MGIRGVFGDTNAGNIANITCLPLDPQGLLSLEHSLIVNSGYGCRRHDPLVSQVGEIHRERGTVFAKSCWNSGYLY